MSKLIRYLSSLNRFVHTGVNVPSVYMIISCFIILNREFFQVLIASSKQYYVYRGVLEKSRV